MQKLSPSFFQIIFTFVNGVELTGRVTEIKSFDKDQIIQYQYEFKGRAHQYRNRVKGNTHAKKLREGQQVNLLAHEKTPHIAFIKELYLEYI